MSVSAPQPPDTPRAIENSRLDVIPLTSAVPGCNHTTQISVRRQSRRRIDPPEPPAAARFYSVSQVARMFGLSPMTVYRAIGAGEFPAVRIRGRLIVPAKAVEAMAEVATAEQTVVDAARWAANR